MKKLLIGLTLGLVASGVLAMPEKLHPLLCSYTENEIKGKIETKNTHYYYTRSVSVLRDLGFYNIKIVGQKQGNCTIAGENFDFDAGIFEACKDGYKTRGVVCKGRVYIARSA